MALIIAGKMGDCAENVGVGNVTQKKREYMLRDLRSCPSHRELLKHFALVDKITGEIHNINA